MTSLCFALSTHTHYHLVGGFPSATPLLPAGAPNPSFSLLFSPLPPAAAAAAMHCTREPRVGWLVLVVVTVTAQEPNAPKCGTLPTMHLNIFFVFFFFTWIHFPYFNGLIIHALIIHIRLYSIYYANN